MFSRFLCSVRGARCTGAWPGFVLLFAMLMSFACLAGHARSTPGAAREASLPPMTADPSLAASGVPFILGSSVYQLLDFSLAEIDTYLKQLAAAGGNAFEIFLHRSWPDRLEDHYSLAAESGLYLRTGTTTDSRFPGFRFPVFDLDQWDEANLAKLQSVLELAAASGLKVIIRVHDAFSRKTVMNRKCYPYDACLQARGYQRGPGWSWLLDDSETGTNGHEPARWYMRRENDKLLELAHLAGADIYFCIMSEADTTPNDGATVAVMNQRLITFHEFYYDDLTAKGVAPDHILVSFKRAMPLMRPASRWQNAIFEVHGCNSPQVLKQYYAVYGPRNFFPNGDGPDPNARGLLGAIGYPTREPSLSQAGAMRALILANGGWGYCTWNRNVEKRWPAELRRANFGIIRVLSGLD